MNVTLEMRKREELQSPAPAPNVVHCEMDKGVLRRFSSVRFERWMFEMSVLVNIYISGVLLVKR